MSTNYYNTAVRSMFLNGVHEASNAVGSTLGPKGKTAVIYKDGELIVTKDGVTVAKALGHTSPGVDAGIQLIKQVAIVTDKEQGDGTTSATVLAAAFVEIIYSLMKKKPKINKVIHECLDYILEESVTRIKKDATISLCTEKDLYPVSMISSNGDKEISTLVSTSFNLSKENCDFDIRRSLNNKTTTEQRNGIVLDRGMFSPRFANNGSLNLCQLDAPYVMLYDGTINSETDISSILSQLGVDDSLLVICSSISSTALPTFTNSSLKAGGKYCAIMAPGFGRARVELMKDLEVITGSQYITSETGLSLNSLASGRIKLAKLESATISESETTLIPMKQDDIKLEARASLVRQDIYNSPSMEMTTVLRARLANFYNSMVIVHLAAKTDSEYKERYDRLVDTISACRSAIKGGVVPGGGMQLYNLSGSYSISGGATEFNEVYVTLKEALSAPLKRILTNASEDEDEILKALETCPDYDTGYNLRNGEYQNFMKIGIVDPANVVIAVVENAISAAKIFTDVDTLLILK